MLAAAPAAVGGGARSSIADEQIPVVIRVLCMFKPHERYVISLWEPGEGSGSITQLVNCKVTEIELPLIRVDSAGRQYILNTMSATFVKAEIQTTN